MPKLACPCGFVHNLSPIPDDGWVTVRDADLEGLLTAEPRASQDPAKLSPRQLYGSLYECPRCGRDMWEKPGEGTFANTVAKAEP
jgi:hypothetical protein